MKISKDFSKKETLIVLGLGSNTGDSRTILQEAIAALSKRVERLRSASLYRTSPMYVLDQPDFLNTAIMGYYGESPLALLSFINSIEADFGRNRLREQRFGQRMLDIDILLFGDEIIYHAPRLIVPHERLHERAFALVPLLELLPEVCDPKSGVPYRDILAALPEQGIVRENCSGV